MEGYTNLAILLLQLARLREDLQVQLVSRFEIYFYSLSVISKYKCENYNVFKVKFNNNYGLSNTISL